LLKQPLIFLLRVIVSWVQWRHFMEAVFIFLEDNGMNLLQIVQGLGGNTVHCNLLWKTLHRAFKLTKSIHAYINTYKPLKYELVCRAHSVICLVPSDPSGDVAWRNLMKTHISLAGSKVSRGRSLRIGQSRSGWDTAPTSRRLNDNVVDWWCGPILNREVDQSCAPVSQGAQSSVARWPQLLLFWVYVG